MVQYDFFEHSHLKLHYAVSGSGGKTLICFHGFGLNHKIFDSLLHFFPEHTIYNFDIPFHGASEWLKSDEPIRIREWKAFMECFCTEKNISQFDMLSYSIGSNFVWANVCLFPEKLNQLFVIAPDGILRNGWYYHSTQNGLSRYLFKKLMTDEKFLKRFFSFSKNLGLVPKSAGKFAWNQLQTPEQREQVYYTWVVLRRLKFSQQQIISALNQSNIKIQFYFGKHDKIIDHTKLKSFTDQIRNKEIFVLDCGHSNILEAVYKHFSTHHV